MSPGAVRISFIITTRNRSRYLAETLRNVRDFICPQDELIIIDGGSTDGTADVVAAHRDIVTHFVSESDRSEGHAFNKALYLSRGELIKPLADDDFVYPQALKQAVELMLGHPEIDVLQCGGEIWDGTAEGPKFRCWRRIEAKEAADPMKLFWSVHHFLGMIFRRRAVILVGGVNPRYRSIDGDLLLKFQQNGCVVKYYDINLYRWYVHAHSGMLRTDEVERDYLAFRRRQLGDGVGLGLPVDQMIANYRLAGRPYAREFAYIVHYAYRYLSSDSGWMLRPAAFVLRLGHRIRHRIERWKNIPVRPVPPSPLPEKNPWTGELR